jgi:PAS domain S-box-containing protein
MPSSRCARFFPLLLVLILAAWSGLPGAGARAQVPPTPSIPLDQPLRFERFSLEDGLSQNTVFALLQDHLGYLWAATQDGLNRYDGYTFTVFKNDPQNANSLSLSSVISLYEDGAGILWAGTWGGGLNRYDPQTGQFTRYQHDPADPASLGGDIVTAVREDLQGRLWVATCGGGLNLLDRQSGQFTRYQHDPADPASLSNDYVSALFVDDGGALWAGTGCYSNVGGGLNRLDPQTGTFTRYQHDPADPTSLSSDNISAIVQDGAGRLWIGTGGYTLQGGGLNRLDPQTGTFTRYQHDPANPASLGNDDIMGLMVDASGVLWVGTWGGGLDLVDIQGDALLRFSHHTHNPFDAQSLSSDIAWSLLEDASGVFWVGTGNGGLNKLNPQVQQFGLYRNDPADPTSLGLDAVGPILEDPPGQVWIGTLGGGLDRFDRQSGTFTHYVTPPEDPFSEQANTYLALYKDSAGTLWTGSLAGLGRFDPATGQTTYYRSNPDDPSSLVDNNITGILEDGTGRIWVGTLLGLDWFDPASGHFTHVELPGLESVFRLYLDQDGALWVGSWGQGVYRLDPATVNGSQVGYTRYVHDPEDPASLADNGVLTILRDRAGTLWLGTQAGLDRFDPQTGQAIHYQESDGLANNTVLCTLEDDQGRLWISTNGGLSRFDPLSELFHNYSAQDGLQSNEFDSGACALTSNGEMYFGGQQGLNIFRPGEILDNPTPPPVAITAFRVFNEPVAADLSGQSPIQLSYSENFIAFEFVGLDFHAPQRNQYAYKLDGFDPDWVEAGTRRYASYTNLPGGDYVFQVKASNNDAVWNEAGVALPLHITPPVWQTWWFQTALLLGLVGLLAGGVSWRLSSVRAQNRRLEAEVAERTTELSAANQQLAVEVEQRKLAEEALAQRAAEELQQSQARFQAVFENAAIGIGVLRLDRSFLEANAALSTMLGYSLEELTGTPPPQLTYPADVEAEDALYNALIQDQAPSFELENRFVRRDGQVIWVHQSLSAVHAPDGVPVYLIGLFEDVTSRKQAQEALRLSEARFRAMFDSAAVGIALMSLERRVLQINQTAESIIGYSEAEMRALDPVELAVPEDRLIDSELFQELVSGQRDQYTFERRYQHKGGSLFWGRITYSLVRGEDNQPQYLIGMIEDVSEEKQAEERLAAQEAEYRRTLEQRVAERTAELSRANQQLQDAIAQRQKAEAALAQKAAEEAVVAERTRLARDLHDAVTQTLFSASLIAEVLPQLWEINPQEADKRLSELRELTRGALAEMRTLLLELRPSALTDAALPDLLRQLSEAIIGRARLPIQLVVEGECDLPPEVQVALYRIAQEALNNVVKYARASQVSVNLRLQPDSVRLMVMDDGIGFDPAAVPPNHLGLRIMRERAETISARLNIYSEPGEGTQVTAVWSRPPADGPAQG